MSIKLTVNDTKQLNIQIAQTNFYHFCSLLFPEYYSYHGYPLITNKGIEIEYPQIDSDLPNLKSIEKKILKQYKNFDNLKADNTINLSDPIIQKLYNKEPDFIRIHKYYLFRFCNLLQAFYENRLINSDNKPFKKLIINIFPRSKKTLTLKLLTAWILGKNLEEKLFAISYNRDLSVKFGKDVRNAIESTSFNPESFVYHDIFPDTIIRKGDSAKECWSLENKHFTFLSTSPGSTQMGIGFSFAIIDDIIKNAIHYYNEKRLQEDWDYIVNTLLSRKENSQAKICVVMHRWGKGDLTDRLLEHEGAQWAVIKYPAYNAEHDLMLDSSIITREDFFNRKSLTNPDIFSANYMQEVISLQGLLYAPFKTYKQKDLPEKFEFIGFYEDTADQGTDYLAGGFFGFYKGICYILEIIYTQLGAEITELNTCDIIIKLKATTGFIESNSGGHAYARNIRNILESKKAYYCTVNEFTQSENKIARILSNRTNVTNCILMPEGWDSRWPEFYKHITQAKLKGAWEFDDGMDMLTGIYEKFVDYVPLRF